jgi:hypothetical protein
MTNGYAQGRSGISQQQNLLLRACPFVILVFFVVKFLIRVRRANDVGHVIRNQAQRGLVLRLAGLVHVAAFARAKAVGCSPPCGFTD